jgi:hypothetical protein
VRLVLHVGMSKSGSTALQLGLHALKDRLLEAGYLYPNGKPRPHNHVFFLLGVALPPGKLPRSYRPRYGDKPALVARELQAWLGGVQDEIARRRPKALLMSGEDLFARVSGPEAFERLGAALRQLADEVEVVAYLRKPSDFYLASTQQILHADHRIRPLAPIAYRAPLEGYAAIADRLHVFKYDRADFPGGDVLRHYLQAFCPELAAEDLPRLEANVSLSVEAMAILAAYRRRHHPDKAHRFTGDANLVRAALGRADAALPAGRPRLRPELAQTIDEGSTDLLWLRDAHGIVFEGIDYERIAPMAVRRRRPRLDEICAIDAGREAELGLFALRHLAELALGRAGARRGPVRGKRTGVAKAARRAPAWTARWWSALRPLMGAWRPVRRR